MYGIYQVGPNDTLDSIASVVGIDVSELKKLNGIEDFMRVEAGSLLIVPKYDSNFIKYKVVKGDTVYSIAKHYGVDDKALLKLNGLEEDDYIYPGDTIIIPRDSKIYITEEETLRDISNKINVSVQEIISKNPNLLVVRDQIIKY